MTGHRNSSSCFCYTFSSLDLKYQTNIVSRDVWDSGRKDAFTSGASINPGQNEDEKAVDRMFKDLTNGDDDGDIKRERENERNRVVTADSLEAERDAMDMMDSD